MVGKICASFLKDRGFKIQTHDNPKVDLTDFGNLVYEFFKDPFSSEDLVIIYYSGHGGLDQNGDLY